MAKSRLCSVPDCGKPAKARSYCNMHYQRFMRYGDTSEESLVQHRQGAKCIVEDCESAPLSKGMCSFHYGRKRHNRPLRSPKRSFNGQGLSYLIEALVRDDIEPTDKCFEWPYATKVVNGEVSYGMTQHDGKLWGAHQIAARMKFGPRPEGLVTCHLCDNPLCVRPSHLRYDTQLENIRDQKRTYDL